MIRDCFALCRCQELGALSRPQEFFERQDEWPPNCRYALLVSTFPDRFVQSDFSRHPHASTTSEVIFTATEAFRTIRSLQNTSATPLLAAVFVLIRRGADRCCEPSCEL